MFIARQHSALSGFTYDLFDGANSIVGRVNWPDIAVATNARFENPAPDLLSSAIEITYNGQFYRIVFEYLNRGWFNDVRFTLLCVDSVLASADVIIQKKIFKRSVITITEPFAGELVRKSGLFSFRYELLKDGAVFGVLSEKSGLAVKRQIFIDIADSISAPVQFFMFFLAHNHAYR
jgi:hypothetical protein